MRKTALIAVAVATVLVGIATSPHSVNAQELSTKKSDNFVGEILLASAESIDDKASAKAEVAKTEAAAEPAKPQPVVVSVQAGDTLSSIAAAHATTWVRLYNANAGIADPNIINPGDQVRVPEPSEQLADRPLPQPVVVAAPAGATYSARATRTTTAAATSYPSDPNAAKAFIYSHESGNNPNATNPNGCYGLGQDCNGVVRNQCGANYACQDAFFTNYAMRRYGSWEAAQAFWLAHHWW